MMARYREKDTFNASQDLACLSDQQRWPRCFNNLTGRVNKAPGPPPLLLPADKAQSALAQGNQGLCLRQLSSDKAQMRREHLHLHQECHPERQSGYVLCPSPDTVSHTNSRFHLKVSHEISNEAAICSLKPFVSRWCPPHLYRRFQSTSSGRPCIPTICWCIYNPDHYLQNYAPLDSGSIYKDFKSWLCSV